LTKGFKKTMKKITFKILVEDKNQLSKEMKGYLISEIQ